MLETEMFTHNYYQYAEGEDKAADDEKMSEDYDCKVVLYAKNCYFLKICG